MPNILFLVCAFLLQRSLFSASVPYKILNVPAQGAYVGAYVDFGDGEDHVTLEAMENFEKSVGKHQSIIGFGSFWARQKFPTDKVNLVRSYGAVPLLYWSPWDAPFDQNRGPDRFSLDKILDGSWDHYIDQWGDDAKAVPEQFFVAFACEMNGTWFPWSGTFYGKGKELNSNKLATTDREKEILETKKEGRPATQEHLSNGIIKPCVSELEAKKKLWAGPEKYKQAYRYVVDRVRARGATNILWVFHVNNYSYPNTPWNLAAAYYPGPAYVDWLGMSLYGKQYANEDWDPFKPLLEWPYQELCKLDPSKPIMLAEWGVAEPHGVGDKGEWFKDGLQTMETDQYPRLKAAVIWHERWENADGTFSNMRVNSSKGALKGYREGVANPFWIAHPLWSEAK